MRFRWLKKAVAASVIAGLYVVAKQPQCSEKERHALGSQFKFVRSELGEYISPIPAKKVRRVHPSLAGLSSWISAVGAGIALSDLDGDGLPNDICLVDPRTDEVIVEPVPGTGDRYKPFTLNPSPLPFNTETMAPMGCLPADLNEDGRNDLLVYYWGRTPVVFLKTDYGYAPQELVPPGHRWYTNAATVADLDGDGHPDLVIANYFPDEAKILDTRAQEPQFMQDSMSRAFNGGRKHILRWIKADAGSQASVTYDEVHGVFDDSADFGWTLAVGASDLDGDLLPELYFANDFGPDRLLHNVSTPGHIRFELLTGRGTFSTPGSKVLGRDSFKGMGVDFADLNGDGYPDIVVSNIAAEYALLESHFAFLSTGKPELMRKGIAPYEDHSESLGLSRSSWAWDLKFGDFNNDTVPELIQAVGFVRGSVNRWPELQELAMGNDQLLHLPAMWPCIQPGDDLSGHVLTPFFARASDGRYYDVAKEIGFEHSWIGRGIAVADVDGDGLLDFGIADQWEASYFYRNNSPSPGNFLGLHLLLPLRAARRHSVVFRPGHPGPDMQGRPAIGAAAMIHLPSGRTLLGQVDGGNGHSGKRSPDLHFGLGQISNKALIVVDLHWRDIDGHVNHSVLRLHPGWNSVLLDN